MSFTQVPVRRTYLTDTAQPATGTVQISLASPMTNGTAVADMAPVTKALDVTGSVLFSLAATDDLDTYPTGVLYWVVEAITGKALVSYYIAVPTTAAGSGIDLATVTKLTQPSRTWSIAQPLNQRGLPGGYPSLDATGRVPLAQLPDSLGGGGGGGTSGVSSVNGKSGAVVLTASDLSSYTKAEADAKFVTSTSSGVTSVNGMSGTVVLNAGNIGAYTKAEADGKYALISQIPAVPVTSVAGKTGAVTLNAADVGALSQAAGDARYVQTTAVPVVSVNGKTGTVVLNSGDVGAVPTTAVGAASGVASLDSGSKIPSGQLPDQSATYVATSRIGAASGVASLDSGSKIPSGQIPSLSSTYVATSTLGAASGTATLDSSGKVTISQAGRNDTGIYVPAGWGSFWRAKRDAAGTGKAVIAAVGSSSTQGLYSGNLLTDPWVSKIRTQLQTTYGSGGSGFFAATRSLTFLGASTTANAWDALTGNLASVSGTWSNGNNYGPGGQYLFTGTAGGFITFAKVNGTTIKIYTMSGGGRANWQYQIDGGTITNITDSGTPSIQVTTVTGLSAGDHTVKLIQNAAASTNFSPCGVSGENGTGVVVNNYGLSGATSGTFAPATNEIYQPTTWNGGPDYPCDLLIYALGANDANAGTAIDTYTANVRKFLSAVRDGTAAGGGLATGNTDILIVMQHIGKYDNATPKWQDYSDRMRGIAEAFGAAMVNIWPMGRNSWNYWNAQNYWGNSAASGGVSGTDTIHMSNAGHTAVYNAILPLLTF